LTKDHITSAGSYLILTYNSNDASNVGHVVVYYDNNYYVFETIMITILLIIWGPIYKISYDKLRKNLG